MTAYKPEVQTAGDGDKWSGNALRFASEDEAQAYVIDLMMRWTAVSNTRVITVDEPVTHRWANGRIERIE